jgi:hypothetical protein
MKGKSIAAATQTSAALLAYSRRPRFRSRRYVGLTAAVLSLLNFALCQRSYAQTYSIDWFTIDGRGGTSTNGQYSLIGTVGQPDAGGPLTSGQYSVTGWSLPSVLQTPRAPLLTITYFGNQAIVSWSPSVNGWTLQTSSNLPTGAWGNYNGPVSNNRATSSPLTGNVFFRLKQ